MSTEVMMSETTAPPPIAHPFDPGSPRKANPLVSLLVWLIILAAIAVAGWSIYRYMQDAKAAAAKQSGKPAPPTPVVAQTIAPADIHVYDPGIGTVTAYNTVTVHTQVTGVLEKVAFKNKEGKLVQQDELLAEIDKRPFQALVDQARGQLNKDEVTLANARKDLQRYLDAPSTVTSQELAAQTALVNTTIATIASDQAVLEAAQLNLNYCTILSPITGLVGIRLVDEGNVVHTTDTTGIAVVTQIQPIAVLFTLPQDQLPEVLDAVTAGKTLSVEAWDREQKNLLDVGTLESVDNQIDPTTGMIRLKARFANTANKLFPNEFVNAKILVRTLPKAIACPSAALQRGPTSVFVYVVKLNAPSTQPAVSTSNPPEPAVPASGTTRPAAIPGTVEIRNVTPGPVEGDYTAIRNGLDAGEIVVTDGIDRLRPGAAVTVRFAQASATTPTSRPSTRNSDTPATPKHRPVESSGQ